MSKCAPLVRSLLTAAALLPEAHLLGQLRACGGVVGRYHRIVWRERPLLAVLLGRHAVLSAQMPLEGFEFLSVLQTNDMVRRNGFLDRHRRLERLVGGVRVPARNPR